MLSDSLFNSYMAARKLISFNFWIIISTPGGLLQKGGPKTTVSLNYRFLQTNIEYRGSRMKQLIAY
jgi:hypothetical protein